jgi:hypothetical protein
MLRLCVYKPLWMQTNRKDMAMSQALALTGDLKLGWYTSIVSDIAKNGKSADDLPSRHEYAEQTQYETIVDLCSTCLRAKLLAPFSEQSQTVSALPTVATLIAKISHSFRCYPPSTNIWMAQSLIRPSSGPVVHRIFSSAHLFSTVPWRQGDSSLTSMLGCILGKCATGHNELRKRFVVGAIVPVGCWFAHRRWPHAKFNKVSHDLAG